MGLAPGTRLGHYDVTSLLGEGGMGQVWQATDTQLNREVALKILPDAFAADPERLARFKREAQILASLNHPNIAAIYGIEEAEGTRALVLELVEGPTLADRISKGPIPLDEALPIAKQIAEALEAAHEAGVIHRDLKPANIKVREDGTVKVLDFGLAKALDPNPDADPSQSPTLTAAATQMGVIMGTAAYMSPEQARGKPTDRRADIWAFGVVLFEMLTGKRAFEGRDVSETLAGVIKSDPDWESLPPDIPQRLDNLIRRCLEREVRDRVQAVGDVRLAMLGAFETAASPARDGTAPGQRSRRVAVLGAFVLGGAVAGVGAALWTFMSLAETAPVQRFTLTLDETTPYAGRASSLALSPDGTRLVFTARVGGRFHLYIRSLEQLDARRLPGTEDGVNPFFSPDGEWVGFFSWIERTLKKVSVRSGETVTLADFPVAGGATWGPDDTIVFAGAEQVGRRASLYRVSAAGGTPERLTALDVETGERGHVRPSFLPGGQAVLFTEQSGPRAGENEQHSVAVLTLDSENPKTVIEQGYDAHYLPSGHLVYLLDQTLMAVPFDLDRLETTAAPTPVLEGIQVAPGSPRGGFGGSIRVSQRYFGAFRGFS